MIIINRGLVLFGQQKYTTLKGAISMTEHIYSTKYGDIHYWLSRTETQAPWLVMLPGLSADHRLFDHQIEYFSKCFNCFVWDAPAHGKSRPFALQFTMEDMANYLHAIFEAEQIDRPVLIGQSLGGYIAQMLYFDSEFLKNEGVNKEDIKGWMFDAGQPTSHYSYLKHDLKMDPRRVYIDKAAPLYYLTEEYKEPENEPYITIACSDNDMVNRREQLIVMETAMLHFGFKREKLKLVVFPDTRHTSYDFDDGFIDLIEEIARK